MRCAAAWALYWLGDLVSRWNGTDAGYDLYQWLMRTSDAVQGSGPGPWKDV